MPHGKREYRRYSLSDFARFCRLLRLENGKPLRLERFQKTLLRDYFAGAIETVVILGKKNGKSTLLAALALYHLRQVDDAECVVAAASREQARIIFDQAAGFVRRSGLEHEFEVLPGWREIRVRADSGRVRVLASDANTADGVIPTLALVDELHRQKSGELYGVFRDGLGPRGGQMVTISTAGAAIASPLGELRSKAYELPLQERDGMYRYARSENKGFVLHEWALEAGDDVDDMSVVKLANPASWQTEEALGRRYESPSTTPWQWARFACGIWTEGERPWIEPRAWDDLCDPGVVITPGSAIWLGIDLGVRHDSTAIALVEPRDGTYAVEARIMAPEKDRPVRAEDVEIAVKELAEAYQVEGVVYDPWSFRRSAELLERAGLTMIEHPMGPERMSLASQNLYRLIQEGRIRHDGDPSLRAHVLAGVTKETERGWRLVKDPRMKRPIDALIALAIACSVATEPPKKRNTAIFI